MSARSADTVRERGRVVDALLVAASTTTPSSPWPTPAHKPRAFRPKNHCSRGYNHHQHHPDDAADDKTTTDGGRTPLGGSDDLVGAVDQLLSSGGGRGLEADDGFHLCRSTWKSVETMARALAVGQSVVSTVSKCYSLPELGRNSGARDTAAAVRRSARQVGTEAMHSSLLSGRLAAKALAVFRRLGQAPPTQPDSLYINSAKLPEAAKAVDPGLDDAAIATWMKANGFQEQYGTPSDSLEALSWTEYRQALAELSPTFRRHGIANQNSGECGTMATAMPGGINHDTGGCRYGTGGRCSSPNAPFLAGKRYHDPWEDVVDGAASCTSPQRHRGGGMQSGEDCSRGYGANVAGCPPRSPGADSYGVLRRKRHAAVSLDYEGITKQLPQVMPPLDPSILVDHIKAQGRRERKNPGSDGGVPSFWTVDPHERLLKMSLQKEQVSETANPRPVQPRHAAVQLRSRRHEFCRRRDAEAGLMARLARNVGVICRQAKIAEAKKTGKNRLLADQERVESQRAQESRRSLLMEMLKSCIAEQLRTIQENEDRAMERVRRSRHVLRKGEGIDKVESMRRVRSSPSLRRNKVAEPAREPCLRPTVPPPDQDARWIYSSGSPSRQGPLSPAARKQRPTITLSSLVWTKHHSDPAESEKALQVGRKAFSPDRSGELSKRGGASGGRWTGGTEGEEENETLGTDCNIVDGNFACVSPSPPPSAAAAAAATGAAAASPAERLAVGTSPATRQPFSREALRKGGDRRSVRRCSSTGDARLRLRSSRQAPSKKAIRGRGAERTGVGHGSSARPPSWSPVHASKVKNCKAESGLGFGNSGGSYLSASSPSVSPWCRQAASPAEWGGPAAGDALDGHDRGAGVVGWADDASGSNA
eukprot:g9698.t1